MEEAELRRVFSSNIKYYRGLRGWSQVKLAEKMGISTNFLADIETGKSWISSSTLVKLAKCFEIEAYELLKPENIPSNEINEVLKSMINDLNITFERSFKQISQKYLI